MKGLNTSISKGGLCPFRSAVNQSEQNSLAAFRAVDTELNSIEE